MEPSTKDNELAQRFQVEPRFDITISKIYQILNDLRKESPQSESLKKAIYYLELAKIELDKANDTKI